MEDLHYDPLISFLSAQYSQDLSSRLEEDSVDFNGYLIFRDIESSKDPSTKYDFDNPQPPAKLLVFPDPSNDENILNFIPVSHSSSKPMSEDTKYSTQKKASADITHDPNDFPSREKKSLHQKKKIATDYRKEAVKRNRPNIYDD